MTKLRESGQSYIFSKYCYCKNKDNVRRIISTYLNRSVLKLKFEKILSLYLSSEKRT